MTYGECPCVPAGLCRVTDEAIKKFSAELFEDDVHNVYNALKLSFKASYGNRWAFSNRDGISLLPTSYNAVFTDNGAFYSRVIFSHNLYFLITVQAQLKKHIKAFTVTPSHFTFRLG